MTSLIIGYGEVGRGLHKVIKGKAMDKEPIAGEFDVIHICFPYSDNFTEQVKQYQLRYLPKITVIHSTVPIGTSDELGAVHSPIRGVHPNIDKGIKTFVKFFGGKDAKKAAEQFKEKGITTYCVKDATTTEALKLLDTLQYGWQIILEKEIHRFCWETGLDFNTIYTLANKTYNEGYTKLKMPNVARPYLNHKEGKIGGHCVIPNCYLIDFWLAKELLELNKNY